MKSAVAQADFLDKQGQASKPSWNKRPGPDKGIDVKGHEHRSGKNQKKPSCRPKEGYFYRHGVIISETFFLNKGPREVKPAQVIFRRSGVVHGTFLFFTLFFRFFGLALFFSLSAISSCKKALIISSTAFCLSSDNDRNFARASALTG